MVKILDTSALREERAEEQDESQSESQAQIGENAPPASASTSADAPTEPLPLDWTNLGQSAPDPPPPPKYPHDVMEISVEDTEIISVGTAGQKITVIGSDFSTKCNPNLEQLILRSHLISKMEGLENFKSLNLLELYDNRVEALGCLDSCGPSLTTLDMSYNVIRDMAPVVHCQNLTELYLANNKLKAMEGLEGLSQLRKLDLGANRIRIMDESQLSGLSNLEELWIGKNKIEQITGLEKLTKLRRLDVQSNRLTKIEGLTTQRETLEELYLAHNAIDNEGASQSTGLALDLCNLNVLDLCRNRLTTTEPFVHLTGLEELWISGNEIKSLNDVASLRQDEAEPVDSRPRQQLETIYLEYNPVASEFEYRKRLAEWIPSLKQIDATLIGGLAAHGMSLPAPAATSSIMHETVHVSTDAAPEVVQGQMSRLQDAVISRAQAESKS